MTKKGITADELMAQLENDAGYQARIAEQGRRSEESRREWIEAARPMLDDLEAAGVPARVPLWLIEDREEYAAALPVLLKWLPKMGDKRVKKSVVRTLTSKWARPAAARPLVDEFRRVPADDEETRWLIGSALETVADASVYDDLLEIALDRSLGAVRAFVVTALGNVKDARGERALVELLDDPDVTAYAIMGLAKMKARDAAPAIERFLEHEDSWVRDHAKKALRKLR